MSFAAAPLPGNANLAAGLQLRLPATSANLGPGFDTLALALALYLDIEAYPAAHFSLQVAGRNREICSRLDGNLLLGVYQDTVRAYTGNEAAPLTLTMHNGIPLGMGCGSSAASRLAGIALAAHFGGLGWSRQRILDEAAYLEGHPDNAAACWLGGFVASGWAAAPPQEAGPDTQAEQGSEQAEGASAAARDLSPRQAPRRVAAISIAPPSGWHALLVLPEAPLATTASRAVLPDHYSRRDTVENLQRVAVLTAAFAAGRGDLLAAATGDSLHQPYRGAVCALLPRLLPLAGQAGILSVTLSGAGPAVLLLLERADAVAPASALLGRELGLHSIAGGSPRTFSELIDCPLCASPAMAEPIDAAQQRLEERESGLYTGLVTKNY